MIKTRCVGGRRKSETKNIIENEKVNPKIEKIVKILKRKCDICDRNKSQFFTK